VTSRVHRTQSVSAVFCQFFHHLPSVKHHCELRVAYTRKNEHVWQWNLFKWHTSMFYFSTHCPVVHICLNTYWLTPVRPYERLHYCNRCNSCQTTHWPGLFHQQCDSRWSLRLQSWCSSVYMAWLRRTWRTTVSWRLSLPAVPVCVLPTLNS